MINELKVLTKDKFATIIETLVRDDRITYMAAIAHYCEENEMEIEVAAKLITPTMKDKITAEAQDLNYLEKTARLPI